MTSPVFRGGRLVLPAKITSSMSAARIALCDAYPITQRSASTRLDLPQPFGTTMPVSPGSIEISVGSTKDLNPIRRSLLSFMGRPRSAQPMRVPPPPRCAVGRAEVPGRARLESRVSAASRRSMNRGMPPAQRGSGVFLNFCIAKTGLTRRERGPGARLRQAEKPLSRLEIGLEQLLRLLEIHLAAMDRSVDEKSRRRVHAELLRPALTHPIDAVEHLLIRQALVEALLGEAQLLGDGEQLRQRIASERPLLLRLEQRVDDVVIFVARAPRQHEARRRQRVERELAQDVADLAGVDVFRFQRRIDFDGEIRAMAAGHRRIFDQRNRRLGAAQRLLAERP